MSFNSTVTQDSQLTVTLTALLRPLPSSHQYSPLVPLPAVNQHVSDLSLLTAPPSGEQRPLWRTLFLTRRPGEYCLSIQPEELVWDTGHWTENCSPLKNCLLLGVRVSEGGGRSGGGRRTTRRSRSKINWYVWLQTCGSHGTIISINTLCIYVKYIYSYQTQINCITAYIYCFKLMVKSVLWRWGGQSVKQSTTLAQTETSQQLMDIHAPQRMNL